MFLKLDGTFFVQLINFAIFFALLNVLFLRPVSRAIVKRREYINTVVHDYDRYQAEANALRERAESTREAARRLAAQRIGKARADASNRAAELSAQYAAQVQAIVEQAQARAAEALAAARTNEESLVRALSEIAVAQAVGEAARS